MAERQRLRTTDSGERRRIFLSYARADVKFAGWLESSLESPEFDVWRDRKILGGTRWPRALQEALQRAEYLVVVLTPNSIDSNNVEDEVTFALRYKKVVVPVLAEECEPPLLLGSLQPIDFLTDQAQALEELRSTLRANRPEEPLELPPLPGEEAGAEAPTAGRLEEFLRATVVLLSAWFILGALATSTIAGIASLREGEATGILWLLGALGLVGMRRRIAMFLASALYPKPKSRLPKAST